MEGGGTEEETLQENKEERETETTGERRKAKVGKRMEGQGENKRETRARWTKICVKSC